MNIEEATNCMMLEAKKRETGATTPATAAPSPWSLSSRSKDHRIVRVSRAFGGKDRHSKVCTVRGLRDRRVRLSVPTAIQLYDLQDRLGLNQPSKVVDWLLNAAKDEIDQLPPLQFPPGFQDFASYPPHHSAKQGIADPPYDSWDHQQPSISLGLTGHDQNLDLQSFGFSGFLSSSYHHNQGEIGNATQPYFPYTNRET